MVFENWRQSDFVLFSLWFEGMKRNAHLLGVCSVSKGLVAVFYLCFMLMLYELIIEQSFILHIYLFFSLFFLPSAVM